MNLIETQTERAASKPSKVLPQPVLFWIIVVVSTSALLILRRPDAVFNAQFWAEDGYTWYAQAYNLGALRALMLPLDGYVQMFPRLVAAVALWVPLVHVPLVFNLVALTIEALPALFLVSSRMRNLGLLPLRCGLALLYLSVPESSEVHAILTDSQSQLAVLTCLILIAEAPRSRWGKIFDVAVLVLCGLTTPVGMLLFAVALARTILPLLVHRSANAGPARWEMRWRWVQVSLLAACALLQGLSLVTTGGTRIKAVLGVSASRFVRIVAGQIVVPLFQGRNRLDHMANNPARVTAVAGLVTIVAALAVAYALWRGSVAVRCFVLFGLLALVAALTFPHPAFTTYQWDTLLVPDCSVRYWYIPKLALMATLVWLLGRQRPVPIRAMAGILACVMVFGMVKHWRYPPFLDLHFAAYAQQFEQLPSGASIRIPLNPGGPWFMTLVKR
jgi:hypothetical protein